MAKEYRWLTILSNILFDLFDRFYDLIGLLWNCAIYATSSLLPKNCTSPVERRNCTWSSRCCRAPDRVGLTSARRCALAVGFLGKRTRSEHHVFRQVSKHRGHSPQVARLWRAQFAGRRSLITPHGYRVLQRWQPCHDSSFEGTRHGTFG